MPKVVPDLHNKILCAAEKHNKENGFEKTDMNEIAADAKIAVGTVYLHFHSKENLFLCVVTHSWEKVIEEIEQISKQETEPAENLKEILLILVREMTNRRSTSSLWMEIGAMHYMNEINISDNENSPRPHDRMIRATGLVISKIANDNHTVLPDQIQNQLCRFIFIISLHLREYVYPWGPL